MLKYLVFAGAGIIAMTGHAIAANPPVRPMFTVVKSGLPAFATATKLPLWKFKWTYAGGQYSALFVGKPPSTGASTTVPVYIIPVKLTYGKTVSDPLVKDANGKTPVDYTLASPIFTASIDYNQGGTDLGTTQYEDAFQRANLWGKVKKHTGYHVLFGTPTVEPEIRLVVPTYQGTVTTLWNNAAIIANITWYDAAITKHLKSLKLPADALPIFMTTQSYLTETSGLSGCCVGGYHSATAGGHTYAQFTFITNTNSALAFSQDVSALSHEAGEWVDDPLVNNTNIPSLCSTQGNLNNLYEVGDPIEVDANFGDYPYVLNGFTYHLQDLTLPTYFGAPASTSIPFNQTFQGTKFSVCVNGG